MRRLFVVLSACFTLLPAMAMAEDYCREFTRDVNVGGRMQQGYGTACLQPDGAWKITSDSHPAASISDDLPETAYTQSAQTGYFVDSPPTRIYQTEYSGYSVATGSPGTSITIGSGPAYYYPYDDYDDHGYRHRKYYRWGKDYRRDHFYRHHHGPGWNKHWEMHKKVLD